MDAAGFKTSFRKLEEDVPPAKVVPTSTLPSPPPAVPAPSNPILTPLDANSELMVSRDDSGLGIFDSIIGIIGGTKGDFVDESFNFTYGVGDNMSLGIGWWLRSTFFDDQADYDGNSYYIGSWVGFVADLTIGGVFKSIGKVFGKELLESGVRNADEVIDFLKTKCFARDTVVSTATGLRPIGEISVGEKVHSFDFRSGEWKLRTVTDRIDSIYEGPVVTIEAGSSKIETTIHHPFWVVEGHELTERSTPRKLSRSEDQGESLTGRWVNSHELLAGDVIIGRQGDRLIVESVSQRFEKSFPVSNLTIGEFHNYSVGFNSILVHNETICDAGRAALQDMLDSGAASYDEIARLIRGFDNAGDVLANIAKNSTRFHLHHAWPKYLGGPTKQDLVRLPKHIHDAYHKGLDQILDKRLGKDYYDGLTGAARTRLEQQLASFTKKFDAQYGTSLWEAMLRNGFPGG
jgi:hypothetical protein